MSLRATLRQIGIGVGVRGWTQVTSLIVMLFAGRVLERADFGQYAIASVFIVVISTISYSGLYEFVLKAKDLEAVVDTCFWATLGIACIGAVLISLIAPFIGAVSHAPDVGRLIVILAPSALVSAVNSWQEAVLLRHDRLTTNYLVWFASETAAMGFAIVLLLHRGGVLSLAGYRYSQVLLMLGFYVVFGARLPRWRWSGHVASEALGFASNLYVSRVVGLMSNYSADLIIGILVGPASAGIYRLASRMAFGVSEVCYQPIRTIAWVRFTRSSRLQRDPGYDWLGLMQLLSFVVWPALAGLAVLATPLVTLVLGARWKACVPVVTVLVLARAAALFDVFLDPLLGSLDQPRRLMRIRIAATSIAVAGLSVLGHFGVAAAACSQVVAAFIVATITIAIGVNVTVIGTGALWRGMLPGLATSLATGAAAWWGALLTRPDHFLTSLACGTVAGGGAWLACVALLFRRSAVTALQRLRDPLAGVPAA